MRSKRIALAALGVIALASPAVALGQYGETVRAKSNEPDWKPYEEKYLRLHHRYADEFGVRAAGRNIVLFGQEQRDGDVRDARKGEVLKSIGTMQSALVPATTTETATTTESVEAVPTGGGYASSSTAACESGGDYAAVNPAGYYGAYQFDQSTWDAYAPEGYQGVNPAEAPPAVQDAAAASVPYDAWPSC